MLELREQLETAVQLTFEVVVSLALAHVTKKHSALSDTVTLTLYSKCACGVWRPGCRGP